MAEMSGVQPTFDINGNNNGDWWGSLIGGAVGGAVGIGANGKLDAAGTGFGECVHIETAGRYTYYTIKIVKA